MIDQNNKIIQEGLMNVLPKNWNIKVNAKDDWRAFYD